MSRWIDRARARVADVAKNIPENATLTDRRKALRKAGPLFHGNTYWGRKMWGRACREYLSRFGGTKPGPLSGNGVDLGRLADRIASGDISFPFRPEQSA